MCFTVNQKHPTAKIAKKDITCYKFITSDLEPPYFGKSIFRNKVVYFKYILNKLNDRIILQTGYSIINRGYHSYSSIRQVKKERDIFIALKREMKNWKKKFDSDYYLILVSCTIPKGEVYFFNPIDHQYVSSNIIINKIIG